jgi:hypothetical protein
VGQRKKNHKKKTPKRSKNKYPRKPIHKKTNTQENKTKTKTNLGRRKKNHKKNAQKIQKPNTQESQYTRKTNTQENPPIQKVVVIHDGEEGILGEERRFVYFWGWVVVGQNY